MASTAIELPRITAGQKAELERAYLAALLADQLWQDALEVRYGAKAADARYDARGFMTEELHGLMLAKYAADAHLQNTTQEIRKANQ